MNREFKPSDIATRYGEFLITPGKKHYTRMGRVSYKDVYWEVPWLDNGPGFKRTEILNDLSSGKSIYDSLLDHYAVEEEGLDDFLDERNEYGQMEQVLEEGRVPEEDREDLERLMDENFIVFGGWRDN